ncbi:DUF6804 family protein [Gracilimonas sp.]|uniref:DUF6804 family protein n=1 Tax=Gracilimonas sp. TaxID=1974203 RepID=UPI003D0D85E6
MFNIKKHPWSGALFWIKLTALIPLAFSILVGISIWELPHSYYSFLKYLVFTASVLSALDEAYRGIGWWFYGFLLIALTYNPFYPLSLGNQGLMFILNLFVTGVLFVSTFLDPTMERERAYIHGSGYFETTLHTFGIDNDLLQNVFNKYGDKEYFIGILSFNNEGKCVAVKVGDFYREVGKIPITLSNKLNSHREESYELRGLETVCKVRINRDYKGGDNFHDFEPRYSVQADLTYSDIENDNITRKGF